MTEVLTGELLPAHQPLPAAAAPHDGVPTVGGAADNELEELLREWLIGYASPHTRKAYRRDLQHWLAFLATSGVDPLTEARRVHTHAWLRAQEASGAAAAATRARRLAAVSAFYGWLIAEDRTDRANPAAIDSRKKPKVDQRSTKTSGLSRGQAEALLLAADADTGPQALRTAAIVALLLYTGIRVGELVDADVEQLGHHRGHRTLRFTAKGAREHLVALPAPVTRRLDAYLATRADLTGPLPVVAGQAGVRAHRPLVATASGARLDAAAIIAEIGVDMTRFPTPAHLAGWAKFAPGVKESAGRRKGTGSTGHGNRYLARVLGQIAVSAARTSTFLGERYRRIARRRGAKRAIVAVGRSVLTIIWHLLSDPAAGFRDLGADFYLSRTDTERRKRNHVHQLEALGYRVTLDLAA
ncbi:site-specific integrase [Micromonospora sp. WMMD710]|uniref:site-specific integrase n=1 Tax=Micromonospora sp. WMMD710 TaxID=3016085 RepID=UPI002416B5D5|nr:site-specific integrase [Micromonospora sp. WMMD710]MDG4757153.1 site-specific integrase [Micromonospora sp. WMMD710]